MNFPTPRIVDLQGGCNFRDLGGYPAAGGRQTAFDKVYRTGVLTYLTDADHSHLCSLGVRAICDLRRADERTREPTRWRDAQTKALAWDDGDNPPTIRTLAAKHPYTADGMHAAMRDLYRALPNWLAPRIRDFLLHVAAHETPVIVHCAAGKDRTGIAVAMLLAALDVSYEHILADYLLTNDTDFEAFILARHASSRDANQLGLAVDNHPLLAMPEDIRRVIFASDAAYLQTTFEHIRSEYGSVDAYLRERVGLTDADRQRLRNTMLA